MGELSTVELPVWVALRKARLGRLEDIQGLCKVHMGKIIVEA